VVTRSAVESIVRAVLTAPGTGPAPLPREGGEAPEATFESEAARALKQEIVEAGRKLWERQYVDGNGGNISARLSDEWVLCTPTLTSKADLSADALCLVDMDGVQVAGRERRSSEILLHLAIMRTVPEARAVIHSHPPHAKAFALAGRVPPEAMLAEHEVFVGPVALLPFESPGTQAFADTVVPLAHDHNTILLGNHGLVTWADTVTHAEWFVEVMDTTCRILILVNQLGAKPAPIPQSGVRNLLDLKERLGLPDARFRRTAPPPPAPRDLDARIQQVTDAVMKALDKAG
jgi:L-fuculose-phosphate aldolase